jgi:hypothetical protein
MAEKTVTKGGQPVLEMYWGQADHLEPVFADNLHLQRLNNQFYLTFGQIRLPAAAPGTERVVAEIRPLVRLVIPRENLKQIANLLSRNLKSSEGEE